VEGSQGKLNCSMPYCFSLHNKVNCHQTLTAISFNKGIIGTAKIKVYLVKSDIFKLWEADDISPRITGESPQKTPESAELSPGKAGR